MATDSVGACCCGAVLPSISLHQPVLDLALSYASLVARSHHRSSPYLCRPHLPRPAPRLVAARECSLREALWNCAPSSPVRRRLLRATPSFLLNVVPTCFCRRRRSSATASGTPSVEASLSRECLTTSHAHLAVCVSRVRHRLPVTF